MIKIYISPYHNVYQNIAIERYLFEHASDDIILYLWSNSPCVVCGRNQNIYNEVNIEYASSHKIDIIRRFSGGGAVYQDLGNLDYTFIVKEDYSLDELNKLILEVFKSLSLDVCFSGRNDLIIDNRKFSGIAYCNDFSHIMYHGTCLIDTSLEELVNVLKPHDYKLKSHSVASYKSRVINLKEIKDITKEDVINAFINTFSCEEETTIIKDIPLNKEITDIYNLLSSKDYIFNDCPSYTYSFDIKLHNSNYHFDLEYKNGIIENVNVYTDDLDTKKIDYYKSALLKKKMPFNTIKEYLQNLK